MQEVAALDAQIASLDDRLSRSRIRSPLTGTVLTRYVESGENDNLIVNKLASNADALGIFGYSFL